MSEQMREELKAHYSKLQNCPVPFEYSYPLTIADITKHIESWRADNVKEAIQCLIEDIHREQMIELQKETNKNTQKAANAASTAAIFSVGTFLNSRER